MSEIKPKISLKLTDEEWDSYLATVPRTAKTINDVLREDLARIAKLHGQGKWKRSNG